jgi:hypothetical protein
MPREEFKIWPRRAGFDDVVKLIRFPGMFSFASGEDVCLATPRVERPHVSTDAKKYQFSHVPKVEAHAPAIRTTVLSDLVPYKIRFVSESPPFHDLKSF